MQRKVKQNATKTKFTPLTVFLLATLCLYVVIIVALLVWALSTSFKTWMEFAANVVWFPRIKEGSWAWNYGYILKNLYMNARIPGEQPTGFLGLYGNSLAYSIGCAFVTTLWPCTTGYLCAKFRWKFSKFIHTVVIVTMILPLVGTLPSEMQIITSLNLDDKIWGMWLIKSSFLGMYFLVFYDAFRGLPESFSEAAKVDGANNWQILFQIMFPLILNLFFTVMLIMFVQFWNEYQFATLYLPNKPTVAIALYQVEFGGSYDVFEDPTMKMAIAILAMLPVMVLFVVFNNKLMGNLTVGGVKG